MSSREKKSQVIDELEAVISKSSIGILTGYQGLSTAEMTVLRRKLRESGTEYKVIKNTLAKFAAEKAGKSDLVKLLKGPLAMALGHGDATKTARELVNYIRDSKVNISIKGGFLGDRALSAEEVKTLAELPSREIMLAKVLGDIQSPMVTLVGYLSSPIRDVLGVLNSRIQQLEGE